MLKARAELERDRLRLAEIVESSTDLIASRTPDGELTYINRAGKLLLGLPEDWSFKGCPVSGPHLWAPSRWWLKTDPGDRTSR